MPPALPRPAACASRCSLTALALFLAADAVAQTLTVDGACPGPATVTVEDLTPGASVVLALGTGPGDAEVPSGACAGAALGIAEPGRVAGPLRDRDGDGTLTLAPALPLAACEEWLVAVDLAACSATPAVVLRGHDRVVGDAALVELADAVIHGATRTTLLGQSITWIDADGDSDLDLVAGGEAADDFAGVVAVGLTPLPVSSTVEDAPIRWFGDEDPDTCGANVDAIGALEGTGPLLGVECWSRSNSVYYVLEAPFEPGHRHIDDADAIGVWEIYGLSVHGSVAAQLTGDAFLDVAISVEEADLSGAIYVTDTLSTPGPRHVHEIETKLIGIPAEFGRDSVLADWTGDGIADIAAAITDLHVQLIPGPIPDGTSHADDVAAGTIEHDVFAFTGFGRAMDAGETEGGADANGDGTPDLLVGARDYGDDESGAAYLFTDVPLDGGVGTADELAASVIYGTERNQMLGAEVALAKDIDGDGFGDLVVSASEGFFAPVGDVFVFYGPREGILSPDDADASLRGGVAQGVKNLAVADANRDGFSDIAIGALGTSEYAPSGGAVFVVYGGAL